MKLELIKDWKHSWKFASVQWNLVGILCMLLDLINQTWQSLPPAIAQQVPHASRIALILFILGTVGRLIKQRKHQDESE